MDALLDVVYSPTDSSYVLIGATESSEYPGHSGEEDLYVAKVFLDQPTGLSEDQKAEIQVFPNPTKGQFAVEGLPAGAALRLRDATGRVIEERQAHSPQEVFQMENSTPGLYLLEIGTGDQTLRRKLILR